MGSFPQDTPLPGARFERLCRWLALLAGIVLIGMAAVTVISVTGRYFFSAPIPGDDEIVQMLTGAVVALCLPYCHMRYGNVIVDVFTEGAPLRFKATLDIIGSLMLAVLAFILAWQTFNGTLDVQKYGNETMMLRLKEWWFYSVIAFGLALLGISGIFVAWRKLIMIRFDREQRLGAEK